MWSNPYLTPGAAAEELLRDLGMTSPSDIEVAAVAQHLGMDIETIQLSRAAGAGRLIGWGKDLRIQIRSADPVQRQRFTIAHEIGHLFDIWRRRSTKGSPRPISEAKNRFLHERRADRFAIALLMPRYLFVPAIDRQPANFTVIQTLAGMFNTSLTATASRFVELTAAPCLLLRWRDDKFERYWRSSSAPAWAPPVSHMPKFSQARELRCGGDCRPPTKALSTQFFPTAPERNIEEHSRPIDGAQTLTIVGL